MTIDQVIAKLQEARKTLPSGGNAQVVFPDDLPVAQVLMDEDLVVITDHDENGNEMCLGDVCAAAR